MDTYAPILLIHEKHIELLQLIFTFHLHLHHHINTRLLGDQQL